MQSIERSKAEMQQLKAEMEALHAHMVDLDRTNTQRVRQRASRADQNDN
jgi:hypothetical protein